MSLDGISYYLHQQHLPPSGLVTLFDQQGNLIAKTNKLIPPVSKPNEKNIYLSRAEYAFIAKHPVIRVTGSPLLPFFPTLKPLPKQGYSIDFLNLITSKVNLHIEHDDKPFTSYKDRKIDLIHSQFKTHATKELGIYTNAYSYLPDGIAIKRETPKPSSLADLNGKRVAIDKKHPCSYLP